MCVLPVFFTNFADACQVAIAGHLIGVCNAFQFIALICVTLECLLKLTVPNLSNMYVLAKFLTNFADSGQAALAESSDQGL